jgi:hypothetical protein
MKAIVILIVVFGVVLASASDCNVKCPEGYHGGCVKSGQDCDCSCWKNLQDAKDAIIKGLQRMDASSEIQRQARSYLKNVNELPETTVTDAHALSKKDFTISLKAF